MDVTILVGVALVLSLIANIRSWFGRGGGRIKIGDSWIQFRRHEIRAIFALMRDEDTAALHAAMRRGDTATAEAILAEAALRYLQQKS